MEASMTRWERFCFNRVPHSRFDGGNLLMNDPDMQDAVSKELIDKVANNGDTTKRLLARIYLENNAAHTVINGKLAICAARSGFHHKFIWTCIGILITAVVGGLIVIVIEYVKGLL